MKINNIKKLKNFKWSLWFSLCFLSLVPTIYQTIRTSLISNYVNDFDIIGQMEWYDLIDETLKALLIVPLYSIMNKIIKEDRIKASFLTFKIMIIVFVIYLLFNIGIFIYGKSLISFMNPNNTDILSITIYLELETIAFIIGIIPTFFNVVFVVNNKAKNIYFFLIIQVTCGIISDFILIPTFGVNAIAFGNMISNAFLSVIGYIVLKNQHLVKLSKFCKSDFAIITNWFKIGIFSSLQQFIDNIVYALMISRLVNSVFEQGNYWLANNFIWGWLLIPVSALSEVIKSEAKFNKFSYLNYYLILLGIFIAWGITLPGWLPFLTKIENISNSKTIFDIIIRLVPFYIAYGLCIIPDSIFIGEGQTYLNMINSIIVNFIYYGIWFFMFINKKINFNLTIIILMFGFGMVVHMFISYMEFILYKKQIRLLKSNDSLLYESEKIIK